MKKNILIAIITIVALQTDLSARSPGLRAEAAAAKAKQLHNNVKKNPNATKEDKKAVAFLNKIANTHSKFTKQAEDNATNATSPIIQEHYNKLAVQQAGQAEVVAGQAEVVAGQVEQPAPTVVP